MACECIKNIQEPLNRQGEGKRVRVAKSLESDQKRCIIGVVSMTNNPVKAPFFIAKFCPFCGKDYDQPQPGDQL